MIKLKGEIDWEITRFGLKEGDIIKDHTAPGKINANVFFDIHYNGTTQTCVVWPDNYEIIELNK